MMRVQFDILDVISDVHLIYFLSTITESCVSNFLYTTCTSNVPNFGHVCLTLATLKKVKFPC